MNNAKVLLVGSGLTSPLAATWNLDGWTVVGLHHGWQALPPDRWDVFLHCDDAPDDMKPEKTRPEQVIINTLHEYFYAKQYKEIFTRHFRRQSGVMRTMFFTAIWWAIHHLNPSIIGVIGCDMHYPDEGDNCFYGDGTQDPLGQPHDKLMQWMGFASGYCYSKGIEFVNFSPKDSPTKLILPHKDFNDDNNESDNINRGQ